MAHKRFVITIDEDSGDFKIETPDGEIETQQLIEAVDSTFTLLLETFVEAKQAESDFEFEDPAPDKKAKLN